MKRTSILLLLSAWIGVNALGQSVFDGCPGIGNAKPANVQQLNLLKNRDLAPSLQDIDLAATLTALQQLGDDTSRWDSKHGAVFHGYVIDVKPGGKAETCNCKVSDPAHRDTHIELVADPTDSGPDRRVIVEVSPRWRAKMLAQGIDWSTATLEKTYKGHWVTVTGWLMFDSEHKGEAQNTAPDGEANWRATAWEIHPITSIELDEKGAVAANLKPPQPHQIKGKITSIDPSGLSFEMLANGSIRNVVVDAGPAVSAAKRLKVGDVANVDVTNAPPAEKATKVEVPVTSPTWPVIAVVLLGSLLFIYLLTKLLLSRRPVLELILGLDGRYSNSKFQMTLWFGVLMVTYLAAVVFRAIGSGGLLIGGVDIPQNLLLLSGLSALSFAGAKAITSANVKNQAVNTDTKTTAAPNQQPAPAPPPAGAAALPPRPQPATTKRSFPGDLINDDYGVLSFARFQIMVITLIAVAVYVARVVAFFSNLSLAGRVSLPDVDTTILAAFGLGQGAYLTNKVVSPES
jgi:hypothetical protein